VTKAARYRLLGALYSSQYLALGFFYYTLVGVLRSHDVPLAYIGLLQFLALFQVVRFLWAPLVDRYGSSRWGQYRAWVLVLHVLMAAAIIVLEPLDIIADLPLVLALVGVIAFLSATQDVAADATAVRLLSPAERGVGNGIQLAGSYGGFMIGGNAVLILYDRVGWTAALVVLAILTAAPLLLRYHEPAGTVARHISYRTAVGFFRRPGAARWAFIVMPAYYLGIASAYPLITPMLVDAGWELDRIGMVLIAGGGTVMVTGALIGGAILAILERRRALVLFGLAQVAAAVGLVPMSLPEPAVAVVFAEIVLLHLAYAFTGTAIFTVSMDWTRPQSAGSDYTIQACFAQLCSHGAGAVSLALAESLGYAMIAGLSAGLAVVGTAAMRLLPRGAEPAPAQPRIPPTGCSANSAGGWLCGSGDPTSQKPLGLPAPSNPVELPGARNSTRLPTTRGSFSA
jgi:predicted MFS family arabinose efflux permease